MIRLIEALNYRCLRYVRQPLSRFHVLVGPNASGKTTFLDVVSFLGHLVSDGLEAAVSNRTENLEDLLFGRKGSVFELAIEVEIPNGRRGKLKKQFDLIRYEIRIGLDSKTREVGIQLEKAWLKPGTQVEPAERTLFPVEPEVPKTIVTGKENFLRPFIRTHRHSLVVFDRHGSGAERMAAPEIEDEVEARLCRVGWQDRCGVVVPDPELEIWVWSESSNVDQVLGWADRIPRLRDWLVERKWIPDVRSKPTEPKEAMHAALSEQRIPVSARLFRSLAERVSLERCNDRAFLKLKGLLQDWFGL